LECASDAIAIVTATSARVVYANPTFREWLADPAVPESEIFIHDVLRLEDAQKSAIEAICALADASAASADGVLDPLGKTPKPVRVRVCRMHAEGEELFGVLMSPIDEQSAVSADWDSWRHDPLTGLRDRTFLLSRLGALLQGDRADDLQFAVLFVDLDNFKQVNDAYGHLVGDSVLREVARRLTSCVRAHDHVVRFGGDEFVVLAEQLTSARDIESIVDRIHRILETPIELPQGPIVLTLSIGVAEAADYHSPEEILAAADRAMYASKHASS
jgi:diguanylate cyclase (GGDEF)-like protein